MEKRKNRSDKYQYLLLEISCPDEMLSCFSDDDGIYKRLNPFDYNEEIAELEEQLRKEFWRLMETALTKRQKEVVKLFCDGMTQMEIAKKLGVNQSSITKSLNGNVDYKKDGKRRYGGIKLRVSKVILNDRKICELLDKIKEIRDEKW